MSKRVRRLSVPELPEVETTRLGLVAALEGQRIVSTEVHHPRMLRRQHNPTDFARRLVGRRVRSLDRIGKFLLFDIEGDFTWVTHLGMSGRMSIDPVGSEEVPHTHVVVRTHQDDEVRMVDPRTFGFTVVFTAEELAASTLVELGRDAWTDLPPTAELIAQATRRTIPVKSLLLDQRFLAGLGNIYADEVLFRARIANARPASSLTFEEMQAIRRAINSVLAAGLRHGGTSLDDLAYLLPDGRPANMSCA